MAASSETSIDNGVSLVSAHRWFTLHAAYTSLSFLFWLKLRMGRNRTYVIAFQGKRCVEVFKTKILDENEKS